METRFPNLEDKPYIEYTESLHDSYNIHFTFNTTENANYFVKKVNQWKLPVEIHGKRIVILPGQKEKGYETGVFIEIECTDSIMSKHFFYCIQFLNQADADEFYQLKYENFCKMEEVPDNEDTQITTIPYISINQYHYYRVRINAPSDRRIVFKRDHLLDFPLYKRIEKSKPMVVKSIFYLFALKELEIQLPKELIFLIIQINLLSLYFQLDDQHIILPKKQKKIDCYLDIYDTGAYVDSKLFLVCNNSTDAKKLTIQIQSKTKLNIDTKTLKHNHHVIQIIDKLDGHYGAFFTKDGKLSGIKFIYEHEADTFLDMVDLKICTRENETVSIEPIRNKNIITFPVEMLNDYLKEDKIKKIFHDIDYIKSCRKDNKHKVSTGLWALVDKDKNSEKKAPRQKKNSYLAYLKICIRQGVYDKKPTGEVIADWLKYVNNNNIFDKSELEDFLIKYKVKPAAKLSNF